MNCKKAAVGAALVSALLSGCTVQTPSENREGTTRPPPDSAPLDSAELAPPVTYEDDRPQADAAISVVNQLDDPGISLEQVITPGAIESLDGGVGPLLPNDASVTPVPESWQRRGGLASLRVHVAHPGRPVDEFVIWMLLTDDGWRVAATSEPVPMTGPAA